MQLDPIARRRVRQSAVSGDGGFMFNSQELSTAVSHKINAVAIVFNDNAFGNVMRDQRDRFNGRVYGPELHNPDFIKLADAYGARGARAPRTRRSCWPGSPLRSSGEPAT